MRFAGMHFVNPPTIVNVVLPIVKTMMGKNLRHRFNIRSGQKYKVLESLSKFRLGTKELLPVVFGGNLEFE